MWGNPCHHNYSMEHKSQTVQTAFWGLSFPTCDMGQTMGVASTVKHCENNSSVPVCVLTSSKQQGPITPATERCSNDSYCLLSNCYTPVAVPKLLVFLSFPSQKAAMRDFIPILTKGTGGRDGFRVTREWSLFLTSYC